jgi:hypothetical protein
LSNKPDAQAVQCALRGNFAIDPGLAEAPKLRFAYECFLKTAPSNSYAVVDQDSWRLSAEPTALNQISANS